ncbi:glycosyltransferase [Uliginosibacterium sp. TH139]|uniref:glycosyltransferase n=1 Tax=Uliginosibacterium sp. TH139 TaxID=2067453 RepID=UPI000C7C6386|nr:glycosyltransferase [Uliginosibacterium sp. TH139]PLK48673.1 hypothetical protein C0V76_11485 [Uliginosibacterium sp. TH139]
MKLLLVIPTVHGGGAEQVAAILAREWSRVHQLRVVAWHVGAERFDFGVPIEDLRLPAQNGLLAKLRAFRLRVQAIAEIEHGWQADAVLAFMDEAGLACTLAALQGGWCQRLIVSMHHNPLWLGRARRVLMACCYRWPAAVVGVSQGVKVEMARSMRLPLECLHSIPNPLAVTAPEYVLAHSAMADSFDTGFTLFAGRLDRHTKGLDILLAAHAALPRSRPPLLIVGDGPDRDWLAAEIVRQGLQDVHCMGWQADLQPFYRRAGLLVVSSRFEGWSNVLMEAMGAGCPVVSTDCPYGPAEILGSAFHAQLSPVEDVPALSANMARMLALPEAERKALGEALRERALTFAAPLVAQRWIELVRSLPGVVR